MFEILINNLRWRLIELLSKPDYIHLDINHFYSSIEVMVKSNIKNRVYHYSKSRVMFPPDYRDAIAVLQGKLDKL